MRGFNKISFQYVLIGMITLALLFVFLQQHNEPDTKEKPIAYERIFAKKYATGKYASSDYSREFISLVQQYIDRTDIHSIVALGCANWRPEALSIPANKTYTCYEVVPEIIYVNNAEYSNNNLHFNYIENMQDFISKTVSADLLVVSNFLRYWPLTDIHNFLINSVPKYKYAVILNDASTINNDLFVGREHDVNILLQPFNMHHAQLTLEFNTASNAHKQVLVIE